MEQVGQLEFVLLTSDVYRGDTGQTVQVAFAGKTAAGSYPSPLTGSAAAVAEIVLGGNLQQRAQCTLAHSSKWKCVAAVNVPSSWFASTGAALQTVQVRVHLATQSADAAHTVGSVLLHSVDSTLEPAVASRQHALLSLPHRPLFPGDTFQVQVHTRTEFQLEVIQGKLETHPQLDVTGIEYNARASPVWTTAGKIQKLSGGTIAGIQAIRDGVSKTKAATNSAPQLLCTVTLRVADTARPGQFYVRILLDQDQDAQGSKAISSSAGAGGAIVIDSRAGQLEGAQGMVHVREDALAGMFLSVSTNQLVNTAVLNGKPLGYSLAATLVYIRGGFVHDIQFDQFDLDEAPLPASRSYSCTSSNPDALSISETCMAVQLTGLETAGAAAVHVNITYRGVHAAQTFAVWHPTLPLAMKVDTSPLQQISGWFRPGPAGDACSVTALPVYQRSKVHVRARFGGQGMAGSNTALSEFEADVTAIVSSIQSKSPSVATVAASSARSSTVLVQGIAAGTATIVALGPSGNILGSVRVTAADTSVHVTNLYAVPVRSYGLRLENTIQHGTHRTGQICASASNNALDYEGAQTQIIAMAELSDATSMELTPTDGITFTSRANESIHMAGVYARVPHRGKTFANGAKSPLVQASWETGCGSSPFEKGADAWISVNLPRAEKAVVELVDSKGRAVGGSPPMLTVPANAAAACVPVEAELRVALVYPGGRTVRMEADARTLVAVPDGLVLRREHGKLYIQTTASTASGVCALTVTFEHDGAAATVPAEVVRFKEFAVTARPHPAFPGSADMNAAVLRAVHGTSPVTFEQAQLRCDMVYSNGQQCNALPGATFEIESTTSTATLLPHGILKPTSSGRVNIHCAHGPNRTGINDMLPIDVPMCDLEANKDGCAYVQSIARFLLEQHGVQLSPTIALRGKVSGAPASAVVDVLLNDGRKYSQQTPHGEWLPGLFNFTTTSNGVASIHPSTGGVLLHGSSNTAPEEFQVEAPGVSGSTVTGATSAACNVDPFSAGDIDLGYAEGIAAPQRNEGDEFELGVRLNTGGEYLGAFDFVVLYDAKVLAVAGKTSIGKIDSAVQIVMPPNAAPCLVSAVDVTVGVFTGVRIAGACKEGSKVRSPAVKTTQRATWKGVEFAAIKFTALVRDGQSLFSGRVDILTDAAKQHPIGLVGGFVAGRIHQKIGSGGGRGRRSDALLAKTTRGAAPRTLRSARRDATASSALFVPGDADFGMYPGSVRGSITTQDVSCVMAWIDNDLLCRNIGQRAQAEKEGADTARFWDAACCYIGDQACTDEVDSKYELDRQTSDAHRVFGAGSNQWESFMDVDADQQLTSADALHLLRAITGERVLLRTLALKDAGASTLVPVDVVSPIEESGCMVSVAVTAFFPANTLLYCAALGGADCAPGLRPADGLQLLVTLLHTSPGFGDTFNQSQAVAGRAVAVEHGGIFSLAAQDAVPVVTSDADGATAVGVYVDFAAKVYTSFGSEHFSGFATSSIAILMRAPSANGFATETVVQHLPKRSAPFANEQPTTSQLLHASAEAWPGATTPAVLGGVKLGDGYRLAWPEQSSLMCFQQQPCDNLTAIEVAPATMTSKPVCELTTSTTTGTTTTTITSTTTLTSTTTFTTTTTTTTVTRTTKPKSTTTITTTSATTALLAVIKQMVDVTTTPDQRDAMIATAGVKVVTFNNTIIKHTNTETTTDNSFLLPLILIILALLFIIIVLFAVLMRRRRLKQEKKELEEAGLQPRSSEIFEPVEVDVYPLAVKKSLHINFRDMWSTKKKNLKPTPAELLVAKERTIADIAEGTAEYDLIGSALEDHESPSPPSPTTRSDKYKQAEETIYMLAMEDKARNPSEDTYAMASAPYKANFEATRQPQESIYDLADQPTVAARTRRAQFDNVAAATIYDVAGGQDGQGTDGQGLTREGSYLKPHLAGQGDYNSGYLKPHVSQQHPYSQYDAPADASRAGTIYDIAAQHNAQQGGKLRRNLKPASYLAPGGHATQATIYDIAATGGAQHQSQYLAPPIEEDDEDALNEYQTIDSEPDSEDVEPAAPTPRRSDPNVYRMAGSSDSETGAPIGRGATNTLSNVYRTNACSSSSSSSNAPVNGIASIQAVQDSEAFFVDSQIMAEAVGVYDLAAENRTARAPDGSSTDKFEPPAPAKNTLYDIASFNMQLNSELSTDPELMLMGSAAKESRDSDAFLAFAAETLAQLDKEHGVEFATDAADTREYMDTVQATPATPKPGSAESATQFNLERPQSLDWDDNVLGMLSKRLSHAAFKGERPISRILNQDPV